MIKTSLYYSDSVGGQRQKYLASARAMLSGKFLCVRKVFEIRMYFWPTAFYLRICLVDFPECLEEFFFSFSFLQPQNVPENLHWFQTNTPESFQLLLSGNFTECRESFGQYGFLPDKIKIFQAVRNVLRLKLPDRLQNFRIIFKLSRSSGSCQVRLETYRIF